MASSSPMYKSAPSPMRGGAKSHDDLFQPPQWRDIWAAVLYYSTLAAFLAISGMNIHYLVTKTNFFSSLSSATNKSNGDIMSAVALSVAPSALVGVGGAALLLWLTNQFPEGIIHSCYIGTSVLFAAMGIFSIVSGSVLGGIISILMAVLNLVMYVFWRKLIPFTAILLRWTSKTIGQYPAMLFATFSMTILLILKSVILLFSSIGAHFMTEDRYRTESYTKGTLIFSVFCYLWSEEVFQNVGRVTASGVFAYRFFVGNENRNVSPTKESFSRATTYSFGSICFGSLLVAIISFLRFLLNNSDDRNSLAGAFADCLLSVLEDLVRYFNVYAFTQIAIYGKPYIEAAKSTFELIKNSGVQAIINDSLVGSVTGLGSFFIGLFGGLSALGVYYIFNASKSFEYLLITFLLGTMVSGLVAHVAVSVINAGTTTFFVCLAEDSAALQRSDPETYNKLRSKYGFLNL